MLGLKSSTHIARQHPLLIPLWDLLATWSLMTSLNNSCPITAIPCSLWGAGRFFKITAPIAAVSRNAMQTSHHSLWCLACPLVAPGETTLSSLSVLYYRELVKTLEVIHKLVLSWMFIFLSKYVRCHLSCSPYMVFAQYVMTRFLKTCLPPVRV